MLASSWKCCSPNKWTVNNYNQVLTAFFYSFSLRSLYSFKLVELFFFSVCISVCAAQCVACNKMRKLFTDVHMLDCPDSIALLFRSPKSDLLQRFPSV